MIGCSVDSHFSHKEFSKKDKKKGGLGSLNIPLLSDQTSEIAKKFSCLVDDPSDENFGVALRATYIIDSKGILRHMSISDLPVGRDANEYLRLVQAF